MAAVVSASPLLVDADDPVAHALDEAASAVAEPSRTALMQGAELRRNAEDLPLDAATRDRMKMTWQALLRLAEARVRLERSRPAVLVRVVDAEPLSSLASPSAADAVLRMVEQRIAEHVVVPSKAITAVDTAHAAVLGLDDADLRTVDSMGDSLDDASRALVEVKSDAG